MAQNAYNLFTVEYFEIMFKASNSARSAFEHTIFKALNFSKNVSIIHTTHKTLVFRFKNVANNIPLNFKILVQNLFLAELITTT